MKKRVTISDIAKACRVSKAAVSYALQGRNLISQELREKILKMAQELGYVSSRAAQHLNGHGTTRIGVVLSLPGVPVESMIFQEIEKNCRLRGIEVVVRFHYWHLVTERAILQSLIDEGVSGLILIPAGESTGVTLRDLQKIGLSAPFVTFGSLVNQVEGLVGYLGNFIPDYAQAAPLCLRHIVEAGHRNIAVLFQGPQIKCGGSSVLARNFLAAVSSVSNVQLELFYLDDSSSVIRQKILRGEMCELSDVLETDRQLVEYFLNHPFGATAAITSDDLTAWSLLVGCQRHNIRIPENLSIFSLGWSEFCRTATLPLDHMMPNLDGIVASIMSKFFDGVRANFEEIAYPLSIMSGTTLARIVPGHHETIQQKGESLLRSLDNRALQISSAENFSCPNQMQS